MNKFITALLFFIPLGFPAWGFAATLEIGNIRSQVGYIAVSIFSEESQAAFPDKGEGAAQRYYIPIQDKGSVLIHLKSLPVGRYAVTVMHDEDGDGQLKKGPMGIPREGFGFSNNPRVYFGAPDFAKAVTPIRADSVVKITMKYLL